MRRLLPLLVLACLPACSGGAPTSRAAATGTTAAAASGDAATPASLDNTTTSSSSSTSTTAKPVPAAPAALQRGSKGPEVLAVEQRLAALKYDVGAVDGTYDTITSQAVIAFQKVSGLPRDGRATKAVVDALATAKQPGPLLPNAEPFRVEIDLPRQVLFLYEHGDLVRTLMISSGGGYRYCVDGECDRAVTPGGSFRIGRKIVGAHTSKLGVLYNPLFFNGGIAIHGEPAVPTTPASHGCVRIPMSASMWFYNEVPSGTPVYVIGGPKAPVPFNTPAPDGTPPAPPQPSPSTTSTSSPSTTQPPSSTTSSTAPSSTTTSTSTTSTTQPPSSTTTSTTSTTTP